MHLGGVCMCVCLFFFLLLFEVKFTELWKIGFLHIRDKFHVLLCERYEKEILDFSFVIYLKWEWGWDRRVAGHTAISHHD